MPVSDAIRHRTRQVVSDATKSVDSNLSRALSGVSPAHGQSRWHVLRMTCNGWNATGPGPPLSPISMCIHCEAMSRCNEDGKCSFNRDIIYRACRNHGIRDHKQYRSCHHCGFVMWSSCPPPILLIWHETTECHFTMHIIEWGEGCMSLSLLTRSRSPGLSLLSRNVYRCVFREWTPETAAAERLGSEGAYDKLLTQQAYWLQKYGLLVFPWTCCCGNSAANARELLGCKCNKIGVALCMLGMAQTPAKLFIRPHWKYSKKVPDENIPWAMTRHVHLESLNSLWKARQMLHVVFS